MWIPACAGVTAEIYSLLWKNMSGGKKNHLQQLRKTDMILPVMLPYRILRQVPKQQTLLLWTSYCLTKKVGALGITPQASTPFDTTGSVLPTSKQKSLLLTGNSKGGDIVVFSNHSAPPKSVIARKDVSPDEANQSCVTKSFFSYTAVILALSRNHSVLDACCSPVPPSPLRRQGSIH